jgi:hypothetical protein
LRPANLPPTGSLPLARAPLGSIEARGPRAGAWLALLATLLAVGFQAAPAAAGPRVRLHFGPSYEFTNLVYRSSEPIYLASLYDSTLQDTVAVFRDSLAVADSPEGAGGLFARLTLSDTLDAGRYYWLEPELRVAQGLVTGHLNGGLRWSGARGLVLGLDQGFEHSLDQRFGFSRRYDTESVTGELGWRSSDLAWSVDLRPRVQLDRTDGSSGGYFQDSNGARLELDLAHLSGSGGMLDVQACAGTRAYPDSAVRDYREGLLGLRWDTPIGGGLRSTLAADHERRWGDSATERHDLFSRWHGEAGLALNPGAFDLHARAEVDWYDHRNPDSVFFDTRLVRAEAGVGRELGAFELELRPRFEGLRAPDLPGEDYRQVSVGLTATRLAGGFADLTLEAGRRHYLAVVEGAASGSQDLQATHSDYHLYGASLLLSQPLGSRVQLKGSLDYQVEVHDRPADTNHIVFASLELGYALRLAGR